MNEKTPHKETYSSPDLDVIDIDVNTTILSGSTDSFNNHNQGNW